MFLRGWSRKSRHGTVAHRDAHGQLEAKAGAERRPESFSSMQAAYSTLRLGATLAAMPHNRHTEFRAATASAVFSPGLRHTAPKDHSAARRLTIRHSRCDGCSGRACDLGRRAVRACIVMPGRLRD